MARRAKSDTPPIKLHRASGQAYVNLNGQRVYLRAKYGSSEANERHRCLISEWQANGCQPVVARNGITVVELLARFMEHAGRYYRRPDGTQTTELSAFRSALRPLRQLYGNTPAADFSPLRFKAVRARMIDAEWSRRSINKQVSRVRHVFKWAVSEELLNQSTYAALLTLAPLKRNRTKARETECIRPVPADHIEAIALLVSQQVWALIQVQRLSGARGGELFIMRAVDIDMSGDVWVYVPSTHKNAHHGHERRIYLGKRAQEVIRPHLANRPVDAVLFSPREAENERRERLHAERETPLSCGNTPGSNRVACPRRKVGERYTADSYRRAIQRACDRADARARKAVTDEGNDDPGRLITRWHPHQLRHNAATELRRQFGIEVARIILGHRSPAVTELYAEADESKAVDVMRQIG